MNEISIPLPMPSVKRGNHLTESSSTEVSASFPVADARFFVDSVSGSLGIV